MDSPCHSTTVYPRACGGTGYRVIAGGPGTGLSPRVRGNRYVISAMYPPARSIPARAGEPDTAPCVATKTTVYPRACGGTTSWGLATRWTTGLSPRVRGNRPRRTRRRPTLRSIPARAGEPITVSVIVTFFPVYPRACGGTNHLVVHVDVLGGLSPRVRGNPPVGLAAILVPRSIPARAGEPSTHGAVHTGQKVYPRACGGTHTGDMNVNYARGLSPRVRGNRVVPGLGHRRSGSIPARAGEP